MVYGDDQVKPDVGVQVAEQMLKRDQVDFMAGVIWSNVMMAVVPVVTGANKIMVGTNAGASPLAGSQCNELYFSTSWNNDQSPEAMGKFLQDKKIDELYVLAPNYQAGKDMVAGLKRYYKGRIVDEVYTKLGQQDYQAEITPAALEEPEGGIHLLPGRHGHPVHPAVRSGGPARAHSALLGVHRRRDHHPGAQGRGHRPVRGRASGARTSRTR